MAVTIHDVARLAGVSHTTVSWAIHGHPGITEATKARVFKAIEELDYHPNYLARSLVKGRTNTIAVVASFFSSPFEMEVLKGIEQRIHEEEIRYGINLFSTMNDPERVLREIVNGKRADAAILLSVSPSAQTAALYRANGMPLIVIDEEAPGSKTIQLNNRRGARMAAECLLARGRKRLALVLGTSGGIPGLSQAERRKGFEEALSEAGRGIDPSMIHFIEDYYFEEGQALFARMAEAGPEGIPDGIFCAAGDMIAMGIMLEARTRGIRVPEDLSIVGYDDIPSAALVSPPLTTIRQPLMRIGRRAWEETVKALENPDSDDCTIIYEPQLTERGSV